MKNITFKKGSPADFSSFYSYFHKSLLEQFPQYSLITREFMLDKMYEKNTLKNQLQEGEKIYFLAFNDNDVIGYVLVSKPESGVSYAFELAVSPDFQRQGIASKLLSLWEKDVVKEKGHSLQLWTSNKNNVPFYNQNGFVNGSIFKNGWWGGNFTFLYKSLQPAKEENYLREYLEERKQ